jgi:hypothetical protein
MSRDMATAGALASMEFIKSIWMRFRPVFDGLARLDFAWGKLGWGGPLLLGKVFPVFAAIVVAATAWANNQPFFVLILAALAAAVLTLGLAWLGLAILERMTPMKKAGISKRANKAEIKSSGTSLGICIIIAAIIAVGGAWVIFNWPTQVQYDQTRLVFTAVSRPPMPDIHQFLGFNIGFNNSGPLEITNFRSQFHFKSVSEELSNKEIDDELSDVTRRVPERELFSNSIPVGGPGDFGTMQDERYTPDDWQQVLKGKLMIYMFAVFKYDVGEKHKISDICLVYNKDFPSVHNCYRNNRTYYE